MEIKEEFTEEQYAKEIKESYKTGKILMGKIIDSKMERYTRTDGRVITKTSAIVQFGQYKVDIPFSKFTDTSRSEILEKSQKVTPDITIERAENLYIHNRFGAIIPFIVAEIGLEPDEKTLYIIGDRIKAMRQMRYSEWVCNQEKTEGARFKYKKWDEKKPQNWPEFYHAPRVMAVAKTGIFIEWYGVEAFIPNRELSWYPIQDAREIFTTGKVLRCLQITSVKILDDTPEKSEVKFHASIRLCLPLPSETKKRKKIRKKIREERLAAKKAKLENTEASQ